MSAAIRRPLAWRFAARELRNGVRGFRIFIACLALGVAALAAAGSTAAAFRHGLASQSRAVLGGDVSASVEGRRFTAAERLAFAAVGRTTEALHVRAMAEGAAGERHLAEVRGVDAAYPLAGKVTLAGAPGLAQALRTLAGLPGAVVDPHLLERLHLRVGDTIRIGDARFAVRAALLSEPDTLGQGFALGGAILVSRPVLEASGLIEAGDLFGDTTRIALRPGETLAAALQRLRTTAAAGVRLRDRRDAAGGLRQVIAQVEFFLGFIGLASLLSGGVGVSTAVTAYLETRRGSIAILKALGAPGAQVRNIYLLQIAALATLGVGIGLAIGAAAPFLLGALTGRSLPVPILFAIYPVPLLEAGAFGLLAAAAFGLGPLAQARATSPAALFRRDAAVREAIGPERVAQALAACGLAGLAIATAPTPAVAAGMIAAIVLAFAGLRALGAGAVRLARAAHPRARGAARIGLANLGGPGSAARVATPAIGLAVALLTTLLIVQDSILAAVVDAAPRAAPTLILTGIAEADGDVVDRIVANATGVPLTPDMYRREPFATARITGLRHAPVDAVRIRAGERWAFDRDIGVTTLASPPPDADLTSGDWWPADYDGPPAVIIADRIARAAGLRVGDEVTISILGRDLDARIAALRHVEFGRFGASVPLILDPAALRGAHLRQVAIARTKPVADAAILRALGQRLPDVTVISVREQLASIGRIFRQLAWATSGAAGVTAVTGVLVLIGAVAATGRARVREAAILKVLGASRAQILAAYLVEYGLVGLVAASSGLFAGIVTAWPVVTLLLHTAWPDARRGLSLLLAGCVVVCSTAGLIGAVSALQRSPASVLRDD